MAAVGAATLPEFVENGFSSRSTGQPRQMVTFYVAGTLPSSIEVNQ